MKNAFSRLTKNALILLVLIIICCNVKANTAALIDTAKNSTKPDLSNFYKFFNTIRYPAYARSNNVQGYVEIAFTVDNNKINDIKVIEEPEKGFGEIVTNVFKDINKDKNAKLLTGLQPGKYTMNFRFALANQPANKEIFVPERVPGYKYLTEFVIVGYNMRKLPY